MVAALVMILMVVVGKIVTSRLLGFMEGQIANREVDSKDKGILMADEHFKLIVHVNGEGDLHGKKRPGAPD